MSSGGGSASSGYPTYIENIHKAWLTGNINGNLTGLGFAYDSFDVQLHSALGSNPYDGKKLSYKGSEDDNIRSYAEQIKNDILNGISEKDLTGKLATFTQIVATYYKQFFKEQFSSNFDSGVDEIFSNISSNIDDLISEADQKAFYSGSGMYKSIITEVKSQVTNQLDSIISHTTANIPDYFNEAKDNSIDIVNSAISKAKSDASDLINKAINDALTAVGTQIVKDAVTAFEDNSDTRHLKSIGRLSAGMNDIGAGFSSALVNNIALLESERSKEVAKYESDLKLSIFNQIMQLSPTISTGVADIRVKAYQQEVALKTQQFLSMYEQGLRVLMANIDVMRQIIIEYFARFIQAHTQYGNTNLNGFMSYYSAMKQTQQRIMMSMTDRLMANYSGEKAMNSDAYKTMIEAERVSYVINKEYYDKYLESSVRKERWGIDVWQNAANLMAAPSGGVVTPDKPTTTASILGSAAMGAAIGAQTKTPWGIAAGALVGGVIGAFGN